MLSEEKRTWDIISKYGLWIGLGIPQEPNVFWPPQLNIKVIMAQANNSKKDLAYKYTPNLVFGNVKALNAKTKEVVQAII